jgi:hypothetical protein
MGCPTGISSDSSATDPWAPRPSGNPNPHRFTLISSERHGDLHLAVVAYPDCTNFEGRKIIVMNSDPRGTSVLDPHFSEGSPVVARFAPTDAGMRNARAFLAAVATA